MKRYLSILVLIFTLSACAQKDVVTTYFTDDALNEEFLSLDKTPVSLSQILEEHKGKTILIDVWANWCRDCIIGMPKLKALQKEHEDVVFVFLSLDKNLESWKAGIEKFKLDGEHFYVNKGWEGAFGKSINLDWIPRYMVVNPEGEISLYRAIKANDSKLLKAIK